jgi:pimeloyl-ACP methyl ester carboxylesterase
MSDALVLLSPESERYNAELLFVHGLWVDARVWRGVAAGFAHRGWSCVLVDRPSSSENAATESWARRVERAARAREAPPIVIGHDAGALVALDLAARGAVRAGVAVAPLLDGTASVQSRLERLGRRFRGDAARVPPPRGERHAWRAGVPDDRLADLAGALGPEPAGRLREVDRLATPRRPAVPALIVAHEADPVSSPVLAEICARGIEADYLRLPGGHWPMLEPRADDWITRIHRWIVKRAGAGLLALRGDEDLAEE